ncbi:hypothetical protein D3C87_80940 [compost metagenome]
MGKFSEMFKNETLTQEQLDKIEALEVSTSLLGYENFVVSNIIYFFKDNSEVFYIYSISKGNWIISATNNNLIYENKLKKLLPFSHQEIELSELLDIMDKII